MDLFFERVTAEDVVETPRSYSTALRSGIDRNVREAQSKRGAKSSEKISGTAPGSRSKPQGARSEKPSSSGGIGTADKETRASAGADTGNDAGGPTGKQEGKQMTDGYEIAKVSRETSPRPGAQIDPVPAAPTEPVTSSVPTVPSEPTERIEESDEPTSGLLHVPGASFAELGLDTIRPNSKQPRVEFDSDELAELVHSIREVGVLQPVVVRPSQNDGSTGYELVMGERRWRASKEAGLSTIPAIIRSTLDDDLLRDALLENLHRSALNPLEEAAAYQQLLDDFGCSHDELAGRLGRSRPQISNTLRLLRLPPLVQRRVASGVLSAGHSRALLGLNDPAAMEQLAQRIVAEGLSVRTTEEIVALESGLRQVSKPARPSTGARHERLDYLATSLSDRLDTNVKISLGAKKGRVSIEFASVDDLNRIIGVISPDSA
ncbi:ParB/RepB/Spo0J family partition protein [Arthrobacter echini]|uniref:ParB/RepB/Spo0J family partition protein n=1 Tax=Arthrobacter echini TaxID=1529066 RepID=UPI00292A4304|nr:ParB/RepB/Spo0J family partition protein [Arthrobacter echini]